jgi:hypothetical protein
MMQPNAGPVRPRPAGVADLALDLDVDPGETQTLNPKSRILSPKP